MEIESKILNSNLLTKVFGRFPSFHDAEVLQITLNRRGLDSFNPTLQAVIHVFEMTSEIDPNNQYVLKNHTLVTVNFSGINQLSLEDFNHQNVLLGLSIKDISDRQLEWDKFEVSFDGIHGVSGRFQCKTVDIESVMPYEPL